MIEIRNFLGTQVENSPLILFRIFFGFLLFAEAAGAILTGWVQETFVDPSFTFSFIGWDWLQPLPGNWMYVWFIVMGLSGIGIMLGYHYRISIVLFFGLWTLVYLMQKSHYNNHHYLMMLLSFAMIWMPAHRQFSLDVSQGRIQRSNLCPQWTIWFFVLQIGLVYLFSSFNKIHEDWLLAKPLEIWFENKASYPVIGSLLGLEWFPTFIAYGGIVFDGLIFFILLYPKTRHIGFVFSVLFHLFNSVVFQIGVFPYMMIALMVFFFPGEMIRRRFFKKKAISVSIPATLSGTSFFLFMSYFLVQLLLPLRHHLYKGDVHWTEEGHRLSWQMMLRDKSASTSFKVVDKDTGKSYGIKKSDYLTASQQMKFAGQPDMIWQFAQYLKEVYALDEMDVSVYVRARVSLNGSQYKLLIDPEVDLTSVPWERFKHSDWILYENRPTQ